jgi:hypothetical protein
MGANNISACQHEQCPNWQPGDDCDHTLEIANTLDTVPAVNRRRIYCGKMLGPLASELSDGEILDLAIDGHKIIPVRDFTTPIESL